MFLFCFFISDDDDDDWGDADTEEAKAARMRELGDAVKKLTMTEDLEKPEEERMRMFAEYLQDKLVGAAVSVSALPRTFRDLHSLNSWIK